jgi:beta-phosphoglucomutase-like phosphatase (HAD superfamily)
MKGQMIEAVLCDIDGTLVQSNWLHAAAWKDAFAQIDIVVPLEDVRRQIGKGGDELIPVFVPWWKRKVVEAPLKRYREFIFRQQDLPQVKSFPKVRELFEQMKRAGIKISLASSAHREISKITKGLPTSKIWSKKTVRRMMPVDPNPIRTSLKRR